ncbi:unnamed protein product [Mytilus coruscus]|uniref:Integrase catalytic domain-containing protein n=1 Tax=Mytilus coruscus TaxID=42192 RepID=A0A6J8E8K7_MYTCO|nr:unnamed protein product [Mytilus coruscus]
MIVEINNNHKTDHRKSDAIYETLRKSYFPVVRENTRLLFKQHVKCSQCLAAVDLPKRQITRKPIPATYSNSRWQMDLKKMPPCKGYNYICNIVDCYSRFAFGGHLKQKTAKEVSELLLKFIYIFGRPRILQTDNGKEFNNADLCAVAKCNLTKEENEFLEMAHVDVEEDDDDNNNLALNMLNENVKSEKINGNTNTEPGVVIQKNNEDQQSEMTDNTLTTDSATIGSSSTNSEINSESVHKKAQEIARMDAENDYQEFVESLWNTRITNMINESESVVTGNETIISNVHYMQPENGVENVENREEWDSSMYPEELFPKKVSKITEMQTFHPAVNEIIDFKPNSALSAGTNVFLSGYWKKGLVINIENDDSKGKVYTIKELENGKIHQVSKYLIRPNLI